MSRRTAGALVPGGAVRPREAPEARARVARFTSWAARLAALATLAGTGQAGAHTTSTGLARVTVDGEVVTYRLTLVLSELPEGPRAAIAAAARGDTARAEAVAAELRERVQAWSGEAACRPGRARVQGSNLGDGRVELELALRCPSAPRTLRLRDRWARLLGDHFRTLARIDGPGGVREVAFSKEVPEVTVELGTAAPIGISSFLRLGLEHILTGYDHLLFLAALLLCGGRLLSQLKVVTAFTLAHSITLAVAALGVVVVPARIVEPAIAASIVWVAVENVRAPEDRSRRALVSFVFGLVHGFAFASALQELQLPPGHMARALFGFNAGVEAGQALVVAAAVPAMAVLRRVRCRRVFIQVASSLVALTGSVWLVQRLFFA